MGDLVCVRILFSEPLVIEFFSPDIQSQCRAGVSMQDFFSLEISLRDIFFLNHPYPPSKVKWWAPTLMSTELPICHF